MQTLVDFFKSRIHIFCLGITLTLVSISFSRALMSIGMFIALAPAIISPNILQNLKNLKKPIFLFWVLYFFLHIIFIPLDNKPQNALADLQIKIPLLILPIAFSPDYLISKKNIILIFKLFSASILLVSFFTLIHYLLHFQEINERILESKEVPIITGITHIYFSMMLSFTIFLCVYIAQASEKKEKIIWYVCAGFAWFCLHLFATRTGLAAFYFAILVISFYLIARERMYKIGLALIASFILIPIAAYFTLPSFYNRVQNTTIDIQKFKNKEDISNRSISLRFAVWQTAYHLIQKHPLGVGMGDIHYHLEQQYDIENFNMSKNGRLHDLHNQFLETWLGLGWLGLFLFLTSLIIGFKNQSSLLFLAFFSVSLMSFMVESVLERQWGIAFFFPFWFLFTHTLRKQE